MIGPNLKVVHPKTKWFLKLSGDCSHTQKKKKNFWNGTNALILLTLETQDYCTFTFNLNHKR